MTERLTIAEFKAMQAAKVAPKKRKYNNVPTKVGEKAFPSKKEAGRYTELKLLEEAGVISGLMVQVPFKLEGCKYYADFVYYNRETKEWIVEDTKGYRTETYKRKKKQMFERYSITIKES